MNREEFIKKLRRAMAGDFSAKEIDETAEYYEDYIDMQIKKGKSEQEVLKELGDPALIAKSMKAASGGGDKKSASGGGRDYEVERPKGTSGRLPGWLVLLIVLLIVVAIVSLILQVVLILLPIFLFAALGVWLYRFFTQKR